jgi:septation ring formation regulator EzrA
MPEPENMVLRLLQEMRAEMATKKDIARLDDKIDGVRSEVADVRSEVRSLRADVASDLVSLEKRLGDQMTSLRRSVMEYHSTTVGHGLLYSEIEERVRRIEQHLKLDPSGAH